MNPFHLEANQRILKITSMDKQDKTAERGHWIGWLKKRIDLPDAQWQYVDFALKELQDHNESLQAKIKALEEQLHAQERLSAKDAFSALQDANDLRAKIQALEERLEAAQFPDIEGDGFVFCGKCGQLKNI